jgi:hypothetical protein
MRHGRATLGRVNGGEAADLSFPPIPDSGGQLFRVRVSAEGLSQGTLAVRTTARGDLAVTAIGPSSSLAELLRSVTRGRPWPFSSPALLWILLCVFAVALSRLVVLAAEMTGALEKPRASKRPLRPL